MVKTPKATSQSAYQNPTSCEQKNANTKCDFFIGIRCLENTKCYIKMRERE